MNKTKEFVDCYQLWLTYKKKKHSIENFEKYCHIWNQNLNIAENKAIYEFRKNLEELSELNKELYKMINAEELKYKTFQEIKDYFMGVEALKYNGKINIETVSEIFENIDKYYNYSLKKELNRK